MFFMLDGRGFLPPLNPPPQILSALCSLIPCQTISVRERRRLIIILHTCSGNIRQVAKDLGHAPRTVAKWYHRAADLLKSIEPTQHLSVGKALTRLFLASIEDTPRCGRPFIYTAEQQCGIISLAVRKPEEFGLPVEEWSHRELAMVAASENIAPGISRRTVGRILSEADLKPHRIKYWENPTIDNEQEFNERVGVICELYRLAPERFAAGSHTACLDEKTGIQALERIHPDKPVRRGEAAKLEFEYRRHGTQALIPSFEVATGKIIHARIGATRSEEDFACTVEATVDTDPDAEWRFLCDRLNIHMSESLVRFVAERTGFQGDPGIKGKCGILKNLASREAFLSRSDCRISFTYTPKHCSWLNQIECWFGILTRKALRHASFSSLDELRERILRFIEYFNETMAQAFKWTYRGKALSV